MRQVDICYHIHGEPTQRDAAKLEHMLRHHHCVQHARLCHLSHTLHVVYDVDATNSVLLLSRMRMTDRQASIVG